MVFAAQVCREFQESAAAGVEKIGHKRRLSGRHDRLHDPDPVVHLIDDVAVDALLLVRSQQLFGGLGSMEDDRQQFHAGTKLLQCGRDALDVGGEIVPDMRPRGPSCTSAQQANTRRTRGRPVRHRGRNLVGPTESGRQRRGGAGSATGCQEATPAHAAPAMRRYGRQNRHDGLLKNVSSNGTGGSQRRSKGIGSRCWVRPWRPLLLPPKTEDDS